MVSEYVCTQHNLINGKVVFLCVAVILWLRRPSWVHA